MASEAVKQVFELSAGEREHLKRYIRFMASDWADTNIPDDYWGSESFADALISKYVEWLKAGEPR